MILMLVKYDQSCFSHFGNLVIDVISGFNFSFLFLFLKICLGRIDPPRKMIISNEELDLVAGGFFKFGKIEKEKLYIS